MKAIPFLAVSFSFLWVIGALASPGKTDDTIDWRDDLPAAMKEAAQDGKPLLIVFR